MANTFSQIYIQTVFAVSGRLSLITKDYKEELHKYIWNRAQQGSKTDLNQWHGRSPAYFDWIATRYGARGAGTRYQV